jgi:predicted Zn-dependent peptidase
MTKSKEKFNIRSKNSLAKFDKSWKKWTLKNGLRCIHVPLPKGDNRFHISLMIKTGSRFEPVEKSGISHLLEHMMFRGSEAFPTFSLLSEAFEDFGGEWNAATGHEYTEFFYSGTQEHKENVFKLLADFFLRPKLLDLETERRIVLRELEGELNENGESTDTDYHVLRTVWPDTSMAMPIVGTESSLISITSDDLTKRINEQYFPANIVLVAVGSSLTEIKALTKLSFSEFPKSRKKSKDIDFSLPKFTGPKCVFIENSDNEYDVQVSFVCEGTNSSWTPAYDMLSRILGDGFSSRLVKRIREELGLVYDIKTKDCLVFKQILAKCKLRLFLLNYLQS